MILQKHFMDLNMFKQLLTSFLIFIFIFIFYFYFLFLFLFIFHSLINFTSLTIHFFFQKKNNIEPQFKLFLFLINYLELVNQPLEKNMLT